MISHLHIRHVSGIRRKVFDARLAGEWPRSAVFDVWVSNAHIDCYRACQRIELIGCPLRRQDVGNGTGGVMPVTAKATTTRDLGVTCLIEGQATDVLFRSCFRNGLPNVVPPPHPSHAPCSAG